jgi:hypothetical protein
MPERYMDEGVAARMCELSGSVINLGCAGGVSRGSSGVSRTIAMLTSGPDENKCLFHGAAQIERTLGTRDGVGRPTFIKRRMPMNWRPSAAAAKRTCLAAKASG